MIAQSGTALVLEIPGRQILRKFSKTPASCVMDIPEKVYWRPATFHDRSQTCQSEAELTKTYNGAPSVGSRLSEAGSTPKDELELSRSPPSVFQQFLPAMALS